MPTLGGREQSGEDAARAEQGDEPDLAELAADRVQVPRETDDAKYYRLGTVRMVPAPDGGPGAVPAGGTPVGPTEGLTGDNFVCAADPASGRPTCIHYRAILTDAPGQMRGFRTKPKKILRFCTALASTAELMELGEQNVYACMTREPPDPRSQALIEDFEARQRKIADDINRASGTVKI